jgi:ketosteroid isomerase-like protein
MTTRETVQSYFDGVRQRKGWEAFLSDTLAFTSFTSPIKQVAGKEAYLEATQRFYSTIVSFSVRELVIDGERACALTRYELQPPGKPPFSSDVAELFTVSDGKIAAFAIYFDTAPFPK